MNCSLQENKDLLEMMKVVSPMGTLLNSEKLQAYEESLLKSIRDTHDSNILGNPFNFVYSGGKWKVKYSRAFFSDLDLLRNENIFKLSDDPIKEPTKEIYEGKMSLSILGTDEVMFQREKDQQDYVLSNPENRNLKDSEMFKKRKESYAKIEELISSGEITATCKL